MYLSSDGSLVGSASDGSVGMWVVSWFSIDTVQYSKTNHKVHKHSNNIASSGIFRSPGRAPPPEDAMSNNVCGCCYLFIYSGPHNDSYTPYHPTTQFPLNSMFFCASHNAFLLLVFPQSPKISRASRDTFRLHGDPLNLKKNRASRDALRLLVFPLNLKNFALRAMPSQTLCFL